jgi:ribonuclease P protein component
MFLFRKAHKIKRQLDISKIQKNGIKWNASNYSVFYTINGLKRNRCGIIVPKKTGSAVKRNRIKREIRENFRKTFLKNTSHPIDILIKLHPENDERRQTYNLKEFLSIWFEAERK